MKKFMKILRSIFFLTVLFISVNSISQVQNKEHEESPGGCDEKEVARIDEIKFDVAHSLINAKTINATTDDGTELSAFYVEGDLVKLTAEAKNFMQEIYVSGGSAVCFEVTSHSLDSTMVEHYYFKDNRLVCREEPDTGVRSGPPEEPETDLIVGYEYYLTAIQ